MDKAFGLSGDGGQHNAFTIWTRYHRDLALMDEMHTLVCGYRFSASLASRLIYERETYDEESSPRSEPLSAKTAESIRAQYSAKKNSLQIIVPKDFSDIGDTSVFSEYITAKDFRNINDFYIDYLRKFDVPQLSPSDRDQLHSVISKIEEAIQAV